ncbi:HNH endonuclease [Tenacibaculum aiptasiae]|uniref:HNH endonuclease n=1 Tax=Tenacibaculum aiptasiae TaxID=426481 RepID=A0A7J5A8N8_9FLAO|nr:HNH endonuclease [Tenacibaculum aiptasiae]KAB1153932.1 HNH endonuclease [Tenacibaculum aiptasiae]
MKKKCFYCLRSYLKDTEHVFPDGLGGQKLFMSCVCIKCNNDFSRLERELYQKGVPALMRSVEGLTKQKEQNKQAYFKAPILFSFNQDNKIVYEVNQSNKFEISLKPQIIEINSKFYIEGSSQEDVDVFANKIKKWKQNCLKLVLKFPDRSSSLTSYIQFKVSDNRVSFEKTESYEKLKDIIIFELLDSHELSKYLKPRIFLDNQNNLRLRAKSLEESIKFVEQFLIFTSKPVKLKSFSNEINDDNIIYAGFNFNSLKKEQAMVKIMLNCLIYYFPDSKNNVSLESAKKFVKVGKSELKRFVGRKNNIIDSKEKSHNIFFQQYQNNTRIRLSLFNGQVCYNIIIEDLQILENNSYSRLVINFVKRVNIFENENEFLMSFYNN